jgi:hypothetical protein
VESPYRGLAAFGARDVPFFFGQDAAIKAVLSRLQLDPPVPPPRVSLG